MIRLIACVVAVALSALPLAAQRSLSLRELLAAKQIVANTQQLGDLERRVTGYAEHDSTDAYTLAFYIFSTDSEALSDTLHVAVLNKATSVWTRTAIPRRQPPAGGTDAPQFLGSVTGIHRTAAHIYLDTHINPSAGIVLVLTTQLRPVATLYGWILRVLPNDVVLYHRSEIHFAPTHSAEVWTYDGRSGRNTLLYPRAPYDAIRRRYVATVRTIYTRLGTDWFRNNNHHMNPELFDSSVQSSVVASADGGAVAFAMLFGDRERGGANTPPLEVAVACRGAGTQQPECRETDLAALRSAHPGWPQEQLLRSLLPSTR